MCVHVYATQHHRFPLLYLVLWGDALCKMLWKEKEERVLGVSCCRLPDLGDQTFKHLSNSISHIASPHGWGQATKGSGCVERTGWFLREVCSSLFLLTLQCMRTRSLPASVSVWILYNKITSSLKLQGTFYPFCRSTGTLKMMFRNLPYKCRAMLCKVKNLIWIINSLGIGTMSCIYAVACAVGSWGC